jgi:hypothetical protein
VFLRVMQRANAGLHDSYKKAVKEVKSTRQKFAQFVQNSEEKSQFAIERVKVR